MNFGKFGIFGLVFSAAIIAPVAAQIGEPEIETGRRKALETVTYTGTASPLDAQAFAGLASECLVRNVRFDDVKLRDTSRSFVGAYSGRYYAFGDSETAQGQSTVVRYASEDKPVVIAEGRERLEALIARTVQFTVIVDGTDGNTKLVFENISHAQHDTGAISNNGFTPVYKSFGGGWKRVISALGEVAADLDKCMTK